MRQVMVVLLAVLLGGGSNITAAAQDKLTLQEQVGQIPGGAIVKVKLKSKETVRGRLGEVTANGYSIQVTTGNQVEKRQITFDETKSVKQVGKSKTGLGVALGIVGGVALAFGIIAAAFAFGSS